MQLVQYFKDWSYAGIIVALTFEFVPAEIVLPLAGYWVYQGEMDLFLAILAGSVGGVTGPLTLYYLGKYGGRPLVKKYGKYVLINEKTLNKADEFFLRHGVKVAFFGRFVPGVRTAISFPCGIMKMSVWQFMMFTYLAMLPVSAAYVYLGYRMGPKWEDAGRIVSQHLNAVLCMILVFFAIFVLFNKKIKLKEKRISFVKKHNLR